MQTQDKKEYIYRHKREGITHLRMGKPGIQSIGIEHEKSDAPKHNTLDVITASHHLPEYPPERDGDKSVPNGTYT
ncbi:MAG: hypothetical protein A3C84_00110 [Candidatus Ryanbacteria bacterium RIFCSPHIGHO2_02_FULL_48_12]|nr:MAG: hypothetical protein A3C84_00110 [Candidatus Ryanbacteria bacterium RIFCSPHIGHO2_02_FULL_48_12]